MKIDPIKILLIEDNPGDARLVGEALVEAGAAWFDLALEKTLARGMSYIMKNPVDLVLLDLTLPDSSGFDTFQKLHTQVSHLPIILLTGFDDDIQAAQAVREGAQDYLVKGQVSGGLLVRSIRYAIERNRAEEALRASEEKFRGVMEQSTDGIVIMDDQGTVVEWNRKQEEIMGYGKDEFLGKPIWEAQYRVALPEIQTPQLQDAIRARILTILKDRRSDFFKKTTEGKICRKDGTIRNIESVIYPIHIGDHFLIGSATRDITERKQMEEKLAWEQYLLNTLLDNLPNHIYFKDRQSHFTRVSKSQAEMFGLHDPAEALGKTDFDFFTKAHARPAFEAEQNIIATGQPVVGLEEKETWPDGRENWVTTTKMPLLDQAGNIIGTFGISRDITERKRAEQVLRENEQRYRTIFEGVEDAIFVETLDGQILDVNQRACEMFGYSRKQFLTKTVADLVPSDDKIVAFNPKDSSTLPIHPIETVDVRANGEQFPIELSIRFQTIRGEAVLFVVGRDITERKQAERALRESEERFREIFENMSSGVVVYEALNGGEDFKITNFNRAAEKIEKIPRETVIGKPVREAFPGVAEFGLFEMIRRVWETGQPERMPMGFYKDKRISGWRENYLARLPSGDVLTVYDNVTERKQAEEALRESEEQFHSLFENMAEGVALHQLIFDEAGHPINYRLVDINPQYEQILGLARAQIVGSLATEVYGEPEPPYLQEYSQVAASGVATHFESFYPTMDKIFSISVAPWGQAGFATIFTDITERKRAEEALRESEERFRIVYENANDAIFIENDKDEILSVNPRTCEMMGYSQEELLKMHVPDLQAPEVRRTGSVLNEEVSDHGTSVFEGVELHSSGRRIPVEISVGRIERPTGDLYVSIVRDISERKRAEAELQANQEAERFFSERLTILSETTTELSKAESIDTLCRRVIELGRENLDFDRLSIWFLMEDHTTMMGTFGVDVEGRITDERKERFTIGQDFPNLPVVDGQTPLLRLTDSPLALNGQVVGQGMHVSAGLWDGKAIIGFISVDNLLRHRPFSDRDCEIIRLYASAVGHLISLKRAETELAKQAEELRRRNEELARLYRASGSLISGTSLNTQQQAQKIVEVIQQEFGQDNCSLFIVRTDSNELVRLATAGPYADQVRNAKLTLDGDGLVVRAMHTGETVNILDVHADPHYIPNWDAAQSELAIPLKIGNNMIGVIDMQSPELNAFSSDDERLMTIFAERAALGIEHSRLNTQMEIRLQQLVALRTIDMAISGSFDISLTLGILLDQATGLLGVHAADILIFNAATQSFKLACERGFRTRILQHTQLNMGMGYAWRSVRERRMVVISNLQSEPANIQRSPDLSGEQFVTYLGVPLIAKGQIRGVLEIFHREAISLESEWVSFLELLAGQAAIAIDNVELFDNLQMSNSELSLAYDSTLEGWASALELRDQDTGGHTRRTTELTIQLAQAMGVKENDLVHVFRGALLHDIGKMGVPDSIVLKPGPLTDDEWVIMHKHPQYAYDMLSPISYLRLALDIPYCHHEKWDGTGYPRLKGEQNPLSARIFAVVDVWDALTSERPYRKAWPQDKTINYIREQAGSHFDPKVVEIFLREVNHA